MITKIANWNVKGGAALPWHDNKTIRKETVDSIMGEMADIFVITEFALASGWDYLEERMKANGYVWFSSFVSGRNGILILVKESIIKDTKELANSLWKKEETIHTYNDININMLMVTFETSNGKRCTVCGLRMLMPVGNIKDNNCKPCYDTMRMFFDKEILPMAKKLYLENDIVIYGGDFNNAAYREDYSGLDQLNYNWHILKEAFESIGYEMLDVNNNGGPINTKKYTPIDHIFAKGFDKEKCGVMPLNRCSDHKILYAGVKESEI